MSKKASNARQRQAKKAAGECYLCKLPAVVGMTYCAFHREQQRLAASMRRDKRIAAGKCSKCNELPVSGKTHCQIHLEELRLTAKNRYIKRKAAKVCVYGKNHKPPADGCAVCDECLEKQRLAFNARKVAGKCIKCNELAIVGKMYCMKHFNQKK